MAAELTCSFPAHLQTPKELSLTVVRLSAEGLAFESPEMLGQQTRIRLVMVLGSDKMQTEFEVEVTGAEDAEGVFLCEGTFVNLAPGVRKKIVLLVNDVVREEYLKEFPAGTEVFKEGEKSRHIYYIAMGTFVVDKAGEKIAEITEEDQFLGEISFLLGTPRTATVTAMTDSLLMAIPADVFQKTLAENPKFGVELAKLLAKRLTLTTQNYARRLHPT